MATQDFGSMEYGSGGNVPNIPAPAKVNHSSSPTMGHYREHIETNKSAGVKHLGDESAGNATHSILSRTTGMPSVPSSLPSPQMIPKVNGSVLTSPEPKPGSTFGGGLK